LISNQNFIVCVEKRSHSHHFTFGLGFLADEHHKEFISHGGLNVLVSLGQRNDIKTKRAVANALANIAIEGTH
jgi:hypothetical protein